jgi:hypothetical protein
MRKLLLAVTVLSLSLFACKKDTAPTNPDSPATSGDLFPVSFSVTSFLQKLEQLPTPAGRKTGTANNLRDTALAGKVSHLYYLIYSESGQYIKGIYQNAADTSADFGMLIDTLPANRYMITLIASTGPVQLQDSSYHYSLKVRLPDATVPGQNVSAPDIFVGNTSFTVNGYGPIQTVHLSPGRIVGRLEVNIFDAPAPGWPGDTSIMVYASPAYRTYGYYTGYAELLPDPGIILQRNSRTNFSTHLLTLSSEITVTMIYPDQTTGERKTREMRYVPFSRGYRTLMSGNVYNSPIGGTGFSISLDTTWYNLVEIPF